MIETWVLLFIRLYSLVSALYDSNMQNARLLFEELKQKYDNKQEAPVVQWLRVIDSPSEEFSIHYEGEKIAIKAYSYLAAIYANQQVKAGIASGHLKDFLGPTIPQFKLRPLWLTESTKNLLKEPAKSRLFCRKILELGYNAVVVDTTSDLLIHLKALCIEIKSYGLKIVLKSGWPHQKWEKCSPLNKTYQTCIAELIKTFSTYAFDYLFWESLWQYPEFTSDRETEKYTLPELILLEAQLLEKNLDPLQKLIFYLPCSDEFKAQQSSDWMAHLANDLGKGTILAFSAVAGDYFQDYLPPHPFWNKLRLTKDDSYAPLMPILNIGHAKQGGGFWPVILSDLVHEYIQRSQKGNFFGFLSIASHLSSEGGLHDCNLWVTSQALWKKTIPAFLWVETWFLANRPEWNFPLNAPFFYQIRALSKQIGKLRSLTLSEKNRDHLSTQECRLMVETILLQLQDLQLRIEKEERKRIGRSEKTTLWDYFTFFASDVRKMLLYVMQCFNVSFPQNMHENEMKESFWTELNNRPGQNARANTEVAFLDTPNKGVQGSRIHMIYQENFLI